MEDSLYINNAGLVILAPYLPRYFKMLGMLENDIFPDPETAARAVLLLQYLATGKTEAPEHELVLNKILCNLHFTTPVPESIVLTEQEQEISEQLLNAVLQNWDKMSNSTVENLRESFLLRAGMVREHEDHFSLMVENKGFDILLSFLPWTISVVSLPWMDGRVETEWGMGG